MSKETSITEENIKDFEDLDDENFEDEDSEDEEDYCPEGYSWYWDGYYASYDAALIAHDMI